MRRRVVANLSEKLEKFERLFFHRSYGSSHKKITLRLYREPREQLRAILNSYLGHFQHANSYHLWQKILTRHSWLHLLFDWQENKQTLQPLWQPPLVTSYNSQISYFRSYFPNACLWIQRGRETDCFLADSKPDSNNSIRQQVINLQVREAGYLACGKKRRLITSLTLRN